MPDILVLAPAFRDSTQRNAATYVLLVTYSTLSGSLLLA